MNIFSYLLYPQHKLRPNESYIHQSKVEKKIQRKFTSHTKPLSMARIFANIERYNNNNNKMAKTEEWMKKTEEKKKEKKTQQNLSRYYSSIYAHAQIYLLLLCFEFRGKIDLGGGVCVCRQCLYCFGWMFWLNLSERGL